jgi:hypothetical protein
MGPIRILVAVALFAPLMSITLVRAEPLSGVSAPPLTETPVDAQATPTQTPVAQGTKVAKATERHRTSTGRATPGQGKALENDAVMRGPDNIALVARLPWWRSNDMQTIRYLDRAVASQVLTAADSWLGVAPDAFDDASDSTTVTTNKPIVVVAEEPADVDAGGTPVADAAEVNSIDLAASNEPPTANKSWLNGLLALLGGALAAASTARFLFV